MPPACTICSHPRRGEIEGELAAGASLRTIADNFGVSVSALHRHRHEPPAPAADPDRTEPHPVTRIALLKLGRPVPIPGGMTVADTFPARDGFEITRCNGVLRIQRGPHAVELPEHHAVFWEPKPSAAAALTDPCVEAGGAR